VESVQDALFVVPSDEVCLKSRSDRMGAKFRDPIEFELFPSHLCDEIPEGHLARQIASVVSQLDLGLLTRTYHRKGGYPYDPRLLLATVLFGMTDGVRESRRLEEHCRYDLRYRFLMQGHQPDDRTFGRFLVRIEPFVEELLAQVLGQAKVRAREVAIDGSKVGCSASWWKYRKESTELPSDPDARLMHSHGRGVVGYNVQIAVDTTGSGLIVGAEVVSDESDYHVSGKVMDAVKTQLGELPCAVIADSGYETPESITALTDRGIDTVFQTRIPLDDRVTLNQEQELVCPAGKLIVEASRTHSGDRSRAAFRPSGGCRRCPLAKTCAFKGQFLSLSPGDDPSAKYLNRSRLDSEAYKGAMIRRRSVERPFAVLKRHDGFQRFLRRGLKKVRVEFLLWVISYDIRKLSRDPFGILRRLMEILDPFHAMYMHVVWLANPKHARRTMRSACCTLQ
jgi:transposase